MPIPKEVNTIDVMKYRGIALQSILPKILDNIMNERLCRATEPLIHKEQHGFRPKHSTTSSLIDTLAFIEESLKKGKAGWCRILRYGKGLWSCRSFGSGSGMNNPNRRTRIAFKASLTTLDNIWGRMSKTYNKSETLITEEEQFNAIKRKLKSKFLVYSKVPMRTD